MHVMYAVYVIQGNTMLCSVMLCMHVFMHVCMHVCVCVWLCACLLACLFVCRWVFVHAGTYLYIWLFTIMCDCFMFTVYAYI